MKNIFTRIISSKDKYLIYKTTNEEYNLFITLITIILLVNLPYISLKKIYFFIVYIKIIFLIKFNFIYCVRISKILQKILFIFLYYIVINYFIKYNKLIYSVKLISSIKWIYYCKLILISNYKNIKFKLFIKYMCISLPYYTKKIIELNTVYTLIIYNLSLFIKEEVLFKSLIKLYLAINKQVITISNNSFFNILISNHLLEKIVENVTSLYIGIKIKKNISLKQFITNLASYYKIFLVIFLDNTYILNISIWNKNINKRYYKSTHIL